MRTRHAAAFVLALALIGLPTTPAAGAEKLIEADPSAVSIAAPAPGEQQSWDMSVTSVTDQPVPLSVSVTGESERLFDGPTPLQLTVQEKESGTVVFSGSVSDAVNSTIVLPDLAGGSSYALRGSVTLPATADNRYQNASGKLLFTFHAQSDATPPSRLAVTGMNVAPGLALFAAGLLIVGAIILIARRKRAQ